MQIQQNIYLKNFNTFGIDAIAKQYVSVSNLGELQKVLSEHKNVFVLR